MSMWISEWRDVNVKTNKKIRTPSVHGVSKGCTPCQWIEVASEIMLFTTVIRTVSLRNTSTGGAGYCPLIRIAPFLASAGTWKGFFLSAGDLSSTVGRLKSTTHSLTSNVYSTTSLNAELRIHKHRKVILNILFRRMSWPPCIVFLDFMCVLLSSKSVDEEMGTRDVYCIDVLNFFTQCRAKDTQA